MKHNKVCPICGNEYSTYREHQKTCSKECMGKYQTGSNNPNYGTKWSDEQKQHLSNYQKSISSTISKRVSQDWENNSTRRERAAEVMKNTVRDFYGDKNGFYGKTHSSTTKEIIGQKSSEKFTDEFKLQQRIIMETNKHWRPIDELSAYEIYFKEADWVARMWDLVDTTLLDNYGVFNSKTNTKGCVRDHMFGRSKGFALGVPPILLRHPANCEVVLHSTNVKKATSGDVTKSLDQLIKDIEEYQLLWKEQQQCIDAIAAYKQDKEVFQMQVYFTSDL